MTDPTALELLDVDELRVLLEAHREEFLGEYRDKLPDWERAGVECLADFEQAALAGKAVDLGAAIDEIAGDERRLGFE